MEGEGKNYQERLHARFLGCYEHAMLAQKRFFMSKDRLSRLMKNMEGEFEKMDEHVDDPTRFYGEHHEEINSNWIYGRPNKVDIFELHRFLGETFNKAGRFFLENSRKV